MILTAAPLAWVPIGDTGLLAWLVCLHNAFVGLQDVAVDALAVDVLEGADRERASGMMYGSSILGTFFGGAGLGIVAGLFGLGTAVGAMVAAQAVILTVVVACRERPGDALLPGMRRRTGGEAPSDSRTRPGIAGLARALLRAMARPPARGWRARSAPPAMSRRRFSWPDWCSRWPAFSCPATGWRTPPVEFIRDV